MQKILADLNESQKRAVMHIEGPLLVLAGAGSGKTRVITRRVAYMVSKGVKPGAILAITFTNKAADEMSRRIRSLGIPSGATVSTFHSFCARLLREFAPQAHLPRDFLIYDQDDQLRCIKEAMKKLNISTSNFPPGSVQSVISNAKNWLIDAERYSAQADDFYTKTIAKIYQAYQRVLAAAGAVDFDDLLLKVAYMMREYPDIRQLLSRRYRYILIDEYQDTNHAQYVIAHGIAMDHGNICVTGDPDQSIYAWRGADINNILEFESDYPDATVIRLEKNYRSIQPILTTASKLIAHNRRRKRKGLIATRPGGTNVKVIRLDDEHAEADEVAQIASYLHSKGLKYRDIAVFYRVNSLSRVLEEAFRRAGIPYQIARGVEFYNRKEIKDVLAYLRLIVNPDDDLSCRRIINTPPRGIGTVTVNRLAAAAEQKGISLLKACREPASAGLAKAACTKVDAFVKIIDDLSARKDKPVPEIVEFVIQRTGLDAAYKKGIDSKDPTATETSRQALRNLDELITAAAEFQQENPEATLIDFLQQVSLVNDIDTIDPESGMVTFMTLHAAKGLEFPAVIIIGCEDGLLPFDYGDGSERDIEEERRLAFVGMTRAKDYLYMTSAKYRMIRGQTTRQVDSPFLTEIGDESVERIDKTQQIDLQEGSRRASRARAWLNGRPKSAFYQDADIREMIEAMNLDETIPPEFASFQPGMMVKHPTFGTGRVITLSHDGIRTRAVVKFNQIGIKTLILQHANLKPL